MTTESQQYRERDSGSAILLVLTQLPGAPEFIRRAS